MKCSRQYIEHFNSTFAYVLAPGFIEWTINDNDTSNISYASNSSNSITKIVREKMQKVRKIAKEKVGPSCQ